MSKKLKVQKIKLLGQDYLIRSSDAANIMKISKYVEKKMDEVIESGVDSNSQQLRIAVFACLEIAGELFLYKSKNKKVLNKIEERSKFLIDVIDKKLDQIKK
jgi:cell division protein ZapA (FtsZ GTPase activity inhibitor)